MAHIEKLQGGQDCTEDAADLDLSSRKVELVGF